MLEAGFTATLKMSWFPFDIPPFIPPELFVAVLPVLSTITSFWLLPVFLADKNPLPNSIPFIAGIEKARCDITDSTESKNGSPHPTGTPLIVHSTIPPIVWFAVIAFSTALLIFILPPASITFALILIF